MFTGGILAYFLLIPFGISSTFWLIMGILRAIQESWEKRKPQPKRNRYKSSDIAAILPAHNEGLVIRDCIRALKHSLKPSQIYVASDGSLDDTAAKARAEKVHVLTLNPGKGKAKAMTTLIQQFKLYQRYKLIFIIDADTKIDPTFIDRALPVFNDPHMSVVFGSARIHWPKHYIPRLRYYFIAYRDRLNTMLRMFFIYGQTWKYTNTLFVIPGFATIYKSSVLKKLQIDTPGLLIEDFNLAFQFHKKRLGKVGYHPTIIGWDQHPDNLPDYWKQVKRWNIGFFQTVKKNGFWPSFFWVSLFIFSFEVFVISIVTLFLPLLLLYYLLPQVGNPVIESYMYVYRNFGPFKHISLFDIFLTFFWFDYMMTVLIGIITRRPQFVFYGLFFIFMHFITSLILVSSFIPGFFGKSSGRWVSPKRLKDF